MKHNGSGTPASGSGTVKNDVRTDDWSFEVKYTEAKSYSLTRTVLDTLEKNALQDSRKPALIVSFGQGMGKLPKRYVVLLEDDYIEMVDELDRQQAC